MGRIDILTVFFPIIEYVIALYIQAVDFSQRIQILRIIVKFIPVWCMLLGTGVNCKTYCDYLLLVYRNAISFYILTLDK